MNTQQPIHRLNWRNPPLALAVLAALQGAAVQEVFGAGPPTNPVGPEFRVNTTTAGNQTGSTVAMDATGDFVVAWSSFGQDGSGWGVYAQRYNAAGEPQGDEFLVNTYTPSQQEYPAVAMDAAGDFVVAWHSFRYDGSIAGVYAQRYNAAGERQGTEFRVNTYTPIPPSSPLAVAMDAAGDFVVAWTISMLDGGGIYALRYDAEGVPQGAEFRVNTNTTYPPIIPAVAMDAAGDFVVVWQNSGQDGSGDGVYAQRYDAAGLPQGDEFRVNTYTFSGQSAAAVAMDATGDFVVAWTSSWQDGSGGGIYAQRYNAAGAPQGDEFRVNTTTTSGQSFPAVAMDATGDFVVAWEGYGAERVWGIHAQRYNAAGVPQGDEFRVNTNVWNIKCCTAVAMDASGDFVVTWDSYLQDGERYGIYAQRYAPNNYNTAFSPPLLRNRQTVPPTDPPAPEAPAGTFSFDARFCNTNGAYSLSGLVSQTVTLTNNNCLLNRNYGPLGTPSGTVLPCGAGSTLDFPATGGYSDYALAVGECVTVHYQIGLQNRNRFQFFVDVGGM